MPASSECNDSYLPNSDIATLACDLPLARFVLNRCLDRQDKRTDQRHDESDVSPFVLILAKMRGSVCVRQQPGKESGWHQVGALFWAISCR